MSDPSPPNRRCSNCAFFRSYITESYASHSHCRRFPPILGPEESYFTYTREDWWCGEYMRGTWDPTP